MFGRLQSTLKPAWTFAAVGLLAVGAVVANVLTTTTNRPDGYIRMAHMSYDTPAVDLYVDESLFLGNATYGSLGPWFQIREGTHTVAVRAAGASPATEPILTAQIIVDPGTSYLVGPTNVLNKLQIVHMPIYTDKILGTDVRLEIINLLPEGPRVLYKTGDNFVVTGGLAWVEDPAWADRVEGDYRLIVTTLDPTVLLLDETYTLSAGNNYTLVVMPGVGGSASTILSLVTPAGIPQALGSAPVIIGASQ